MERGEELRKGNRNDFLLQLSGGKEEKQYRNKNFHVVVEKFVAMI